MARAKRAFKFLTPQRLNELWGVLLLAGSLFLLMSLVSYHREDISFSTFPPSAEIRNLCGVVGAGLAFLVREGIGLTGYVLPLLGLLWSVSRFNGRAIERPFFKILSTALLCLAASGLLAIVWTQAPDARVYRGGVLGLLVGDQVVQYFGWWGAVMVLLTVGVLCLLVSTELVVWPILKAGGEAAVDSAQWLGGRMGNTMRQAWGSAAGGTSTMVHRAPRKTQVLPAKEPVPEMKINQPPPAPKVKEMSPSPKIKETVPAPVIASAAKQSRPQNEIASGASRLRNDARTESPAQPSPVVKKPFELPSLDLLNPAPPGQQTGLTKEMVEASAKVLEDTLRDFGLETRVAEVELGPVVTRYELEPAPGVKIQKIATLADDLALALKSTTVRIIAPIPGKARVGIEVPNPSSMMVTLREVLQSKEFQGSRSKLALAIGKDAAGHPLIADLAAMPHLLIAGATGSGKTVCMNGLVVSLLFNAAPEQVKFLMVDPKMVELAAFNGLPHLLMPVITSAKKVPAALEWVIDEMETRYRLFAKLGVRNIDGYHQKQAAGQLPSEEIPDHLPYIVVIIDELADLMLIAQAEIEKSIARLAHLSRAVGIHMVLATQRPSVDVLTGVIKANFPARISFQVASRVDSRTVLDAIGAEKLLGKGDLLFMPPGASKMIRAQGTLVTDPEIERVVQFLRAQRAPSYDIHILDDLEGRASTAGREAPKDALYDEAVRVVVESGQASVSLLQRRMRLGYGRAARILDQMEEQGIVGPIRGAKPREVFLKEAPAVSGSVPVGEEADDDHR
ncbi:MAG: DNA translocase FtsK [Candidatus Omnitrophica bacterium]|nr:DNA translocase FtsK [Candidatus Omnitrophota bacterium]